jgi:hypothetical protein
MALTRTELADPECPVSDSDYDAIESAIMESARGRWFLSEFGRRHRHADTLMVMSAINSLHDSLQQSIQAGIESTAGRVQASIHGSVQGRYQAALAAQRRGQYLVSTQISADVMPERPAPVLRVAPSAAEEPAAPDLVAIGEDTFQFKV